MQAPEPTITAGAARHVVFHPPTASDAVEAE